MENRPTSCVLAQAGWGTQPLRRFARLGVRVKMPLPQMAASPTEGVVRSGEAALPTDCRLWKIDLQSLPQSIRRGEVSSPKRVGRPNPYEDSHTRLSTFLPRCLCGAFLTHYASRIRLGSFNSPVVSISRSRLRRGKMPRLRVRVIPKSVKKRKTK